jgi:hypothetical protein
MSHKCAFCGEMAEHFIHCQTCGKPICAAHRTPLSDASTRVLGAARGAGVPPLPQLYLCPDHTDGSSGTAV